MNTSQVVDRLRGILPVVIDGEDWEEPAEELDGETDGRSDD